MENIMQTLSSEIAKQRKNRGLTQEALGAMTGVSFQAVSKWENGQSLPDISLLPLLADIFGCSVDELFGRGCSEDSPKAVFPEDGKLRAAVFRGTQPLLSCDDMSNFTFKLEGEAADVISYCSIECNGDIKGNAEAQLGIKCGDIGGNATAQLGIKCGDIGGNATAQLGMNCGNIGGNATAGNGMNCGNIGGCAAAGNGMNAAIIAGDASAGDKIKCDRINGSATSGGDITCGDIGGNAEAGRDISCTAINGDAESGGDITCGDIGGNAEADGDISCTAINGGAKPE